MLAVFTNLLLKTKNPIRPARRMGWDKRGLGWGVSRRVPR